MSQPVALSQAMAGATITTAMPSPLDPRLARVIRDLEKVARTLDELHAEVIEVLRDQQATWEDLGEAYDPPKSRQAIAKWVATRRRRREGG